MKPNDSLFYFLTETEATEGRRIGSTEKFARIMRYQRLKKLFEERLARKCGDLSVVFEIFLTNYFQDHVELEYSHKTGVGNDDVDFRVKDGPYVWLLEAVSIAESKAQKDSTIEHENGLSTCSTNAMDDIKLAQKKICEKVFRDKRVRKFPPPTENVFNVVVVDTKGDLTGYDAKDVEMVTRGAWNFVGLFDDRPHPLEGVEHLRDRIHALVFMTGPTHYRSKGMFIRDGVAINENLLRTQGVEALPDLPIKIG